MERRLITAFMATILDRLHQRRHLALTSSSQPCIRCKYSNETCVTMSSLLSTEILLVRSLAQRLEISACVVWNWSDLLKPDCCKYSDDSFMTISPLLGFEKLLVSIGQRYVLTQPFYRYGYCNKSVELISLHHLSGNRRMLDCQM
jgi:hypothetical protein